MSGKYDIETFIGDIVALVQANLANKIAAINTEKNDDYELVAVDNADYYNDLSSQILNASPFMYYTPMNIETSSNGAHTSIEVTLLLVVAFNNVNAGGTINKVLRYSRALREIVQENYKQSASASRLLIEELVPSNVSIIEGEVHKMGGIELKATLVG